MINPNSMSSSLLTEQNATACMEIRAKNAEAALEAERRVSQHLNYQVLELNKIILELRQELYAEQVASERPPIGSCG
jgi:hypothetical protein